MRRTLRGRLDWSVTAGYGDSDYLVLVGPCAALNLVEGVGNFAPLRGKRQQPFPLGIVACLYCALLAIFGMGKAIVEL